MIRTFIIACVSAAVLGGAAGAAPVRTANVEAELVSSRAAITRGQSFTIGFRQTIRPGWHTYWRNPGDSGIPTSLTWTLPKGFSAGPIEWPAPTAIKVETLVNYGYSGEVLFPVEITAPKDARRPITLKAHAAWLVCEEICIPEEADLTLDLNVAGHELPDMTWAPRLTAARAMVPQRADVVGVVGRSGKGWALDVSGGPLAALLQAKAVRDPQFFPFAGDAIDHAAPQKPRISADHISLALTPAPDAVLDAKPLEGVITFEAKEGDAWVKRAFEIGAAPGAVSQTSDASAPAPDSFGLFAALGFALLGGLILNVMPCVFPVLSIKALSLARGGDEHEARRHGFYFLGGVLATFLALAGALIALQAAGAQIGWGFQLQEPLVVAGLGLLFFAIGLNLLGAYEFGSGLQNVGAGLASKGGDAGAFFTGALAVVAATPCTAPFMGAAMGFAATQPAAISLLVFAALGVGFAAPFFLLSVAPPLRALLPKPGAWMDVFKQILAFPMFAAAIWLVWVLTQQSGPNGLIALLGAFLAFGFLVWATRALKSGLGRWIAIGLAVLALLGAGFGVQSSQALAPSADAEPAKEGALTIETWTPERQAALQAAGTPVFINFTAAWCVTCQVNEKVALQSPEVAAAFKKVGVVYLKGDWTARDSVIAEALKSHGRAGVPLYLFYAPGAAAPKVLPQILTPGIVADAIGA